MKIITQRFAVESVTSLFIRTDFGLARISSENLYKSTATKNLPLRALAPEALRDQIYSKETDVWAFAM